MDQAKTKRIKIDKREFFTKAEVFNSKIVECGNKYGNGNQELRPVAGEIKYVQRT